MKTAQSAPTATSAGAPLEAAPAAEPSSFDLHLTNLFDTVTGMFSRGDTLAQPDELVRQLQTLSALWAVVFLVVGVLCLFNGYKFHRIATVTVAALVGLFVGYALARQVGAPSFIVAGCIGVLCAVLAVPLLKYAVAVFGGLAGAFAGANLWAGIAHAVNASAAHRAAEAGRQATVIMPTEAYWIGALIGLILCGMLAFVLFKLAIIMFTSVSGSTIAVLGGLALLLSFEPWQATIVQGLTANHLVIPLLVFVPAIIGLIMQEASGKTPAAAKPAN